MTLQKYILRQVMWPILAAFLSLNLLFLVVQLLKVVEMVAGSGVDGVSLLQVTLLFLPGFAVYTIPISILTGVLLGFGRLSEDGELIALAGAGIPAVHLWWAPLGMGLLGALLSVGISSFLAPAATDYLHRNLVQMSKRQVVASLQAGKFFEEIPGVVLYPRARSADGKSWDGFLMYDQRPDRARHLLLSSRARLEPAAENDTLLMHLQDGELHARDWKRGRYSTVRYGRAQVQVDIAVLVGDRTRFIPFMERMTMAELKTASLDPERTPRERMQCASTWHRRFAFPVASVLFALFGSVLGAWGKLRGRRSTLLASVSVIAGYYLLMRMGDALVERTWLEAAQAAWMPNLLLALTVLSWMAAKARRL